MGEKSMQHRKNKPHICPGCGTAFLARYDVKYCTPECYWKSRETGNFWPDQRGYLIQRHNGKRVAVHRVVMEQHMGRPLLTGEQVHHKDGNKQNNAIDNLELMSRNEHLAHHVADPEHMKNMAMSQMISWAKRYAALCDE